MKTEMKKLNALKPNEIFWKIAEEAELIDVFASASDPNDSASIGAIFNSAPEIYNKWMTTYMNKISIQKAENKLWSNDLAKRFLKGALGVGESIEDTLFNLIQSVPYGMNTDGAKNYKDYTQKKPEHAFYTINMDRQYIVTKYEREFKKAFLSWEAFGSALTAFDNALATSINADFFLLIRYALASAYIKNNLRGINLPASYTSKKFLETERNLFDGMAYLSNNYTKTEIPNFAENPVFIMDYKLKNRISVNEYSTAFGPEYEKLVGSILELNAFDFSAWELKRVNQLINGDGTLANNYDDATAVFTASDLAKLKRVKGIVLDTEFVQYYQNDVYADAERDPYGRKTNYIYGYQELWCVSPFACAVAILEPPTATDIAIMSVNGGTLSGTTVTKSATADATVRLTNVCGDCTVTGTGTYDAESGILTITATSAGTVKVADENGHEFTVTVAIG